MDKNKKLFVRPPQDPRFEHLRILKWNVRKKPTPEHGKYSIRFTLIMDDNTVLNRQKGGFPSKSSAMEYRDALIVKLYNQEYMPYRFTFKEFYDYWLYYYLIDVRKLAYNIFCGYRTVVNRLCDYFGSDTYIDSVTTVNLNHFIATCKNQSSRRATYSVLHTSFLYAKEKRIILSNPATLALEISKRKFKNLHLKTKKNAFTLQELITLLLKAKEGDYTFYLFLLLATVTGARVSETRALCFRNIDFTKQELVIDCQLGRGYDNKGYENNTLYNQKRKLKTLNSSRVIPLPDFVMDELYLAKARYNWAKKNDAQFDRSLDFVLFKEHGQPIGRPYYNFKKLMKKCNINPSEHVWHDLRHTYATILSENNMNMKVVSKILGHYSDVFTDKEYVIRKAEQTVYNVKEPMELFISSFETNLADRTIPVYNVSSITDYFLDL